MAERTHLLDGGKTRVTLKANKVWVDLGASLNVAWNGESIREQERRKSNNWWNPFSWGTEWVRADPALNFDVVFLGANGQPLVTQFTVPKQTSGTGYLKKEVNLVFVGFPRPTGENLDARGVRKVIVSYTVDGTRFTVEQA